jgi:hypothetical protein
VTIQRQDRLYLTDNLQGIFSRACLRIPGSFGSVRQLVDAIMQYLTEHNLNPKRYVWRAKGEEILAKSNEPGKRPLVKAMMSLLFKRH